jgi:hypothetical protein
MKRIMRELRKIKHLFLIARQYKDFYQRDFTAPSPNLFKMKTFVRFANPKGVWIETGTYMGSTSEFLAKRFPKVISIEPSDYFFDYAKTRLQKFENVTVLKGTSEDLFEDALVSAAPMANVWLDGHYSEGGTFLGNSVTPIMDELLAINRHKEKFNSLVIFIDDIRLFARSNDSESGYPPFQALLDWCRENSFDWQIQNDILIAEMKN